MEVHSRKREWVCKVTLMCVFTKISWLSPPNEKIKRKRFKQLFIACT